MKSTTMIFFIIVLSSCATTHYEEVLFPTSEDSRSLTFTSAVSEPVPFYVIEPENEYPYNDVVPFAAKQTLHFRENIGPTIGPRF